MPDRAAIHRVLERARRYVEQETPSTAADALASLAGTIEQELLALGARVDRFDAPGFGRNLRAVLPGSDAGARPILALAHIDTVHPVGTLAQRPFRIEDGRAFGPGVYDMKSGLAVTIEALTWLRENGRATRRPVHLLVTCDEEIGSRSAYDMIVAEAQGAAAVLVPEPCLPDGGVKTFRKGVATYRITGRGRAAHAGIDGHTAVSGSAELVHALASALALADHDRGTTINIGILGGGTASNVVTAEAFAILDVRTTEPAEADRIHTALTSLAPRHPAAGLEVVRTESRPPLLRSAAVLGLYHHARAIAGEWDIALTEGGTGGGSDGSIAASTGAAVLDGLGPRGGGAHATDEHIVLADLPFRLALMARLMETL
jgi:glutamate carboxypeptidase